MNKIYKVIWSKVKHQYVVVSELAHSNGKQSRTAKKSLRSRIAALVVCGAIAAFGVYGALPVQQAFAADDKVQQATQTQYVAFKANRNSDEWQQGYQKIYSESDKTLITFRPQTVTLSDGRELYYWVREGYTLEPQENVQYIPDRLMDTQWTDGIKPNFTMSAEITDPEKIKGSVLKTTESNSVGTKATTTRGESLETVEVGHYTGVSNSEGVETGYDWNYIIDPVGNGNQSQYIDIKAAIPEGKNNVWDSGYLKAVEQIGDNYYLAGTNRTVKVDPDNIYIINNKAGVFVTTPNKDSYTEKDIYTGRVYGAHNEILMTSKDDNGQYYTYWAGKVNDDENVLLSDSNLTLGDYRDQIDTFYRNDRKLAAADIKSVELDSKNKSINLITNTKFDENGNPIEGMEETIQGFTVSKTISQTNGKGNAQIKFSQKDAEGNETSSFVVDAGSIVKANEKTSASDETLTSLSVDGTNYKLSQGKTYTKGSGIIVDNTDNTISVDLAKDGDKNISGLHFNATGQLANNLSVKEATWVEGDKNTTHSNSGNWSIIEDTGNGTTKTFTNTTLDSTASETANEEAEENSTYVDKDTETGKVTTTYGRDYVVKDTDGNEVGLKDIASAKELQNIDIKKIGDLQYSEVINEEDPNYNPDTDLIIKDDDSLTVAVGKLDNRVTNNTTSIENLTQTVNEGWTAQAGEDSIKVTPKDGKNTLKFAGDNNITVSANEATSTIQVGLEDDITLDDNVENGNNVQLSGTNGTISAHNSKFIFGETGNYDNANDMTFDQNGLTVTNTQTMRENDETTTSSTVINGGSITTGNVTAGGITVNADNGGTVNGLTNKTWDAENYISGQAATEDQLKEAVDDIEENDYDGWKVSANGVENGVDVTTGSTVDFSNTDGNIVVGQDGTNLTFDLAKDITLDDGVENGNNVQLSGTNGTISAHNSKFIFGETGNYDNANDMTFDQNGLTVTNTQTMRENDETTTSSTVINGGSITTGNVTAGGITVNADNGGTVNGLTNKTWDAENYISGQAATEDQLKEVVDDIEANDYDGWKVSANGQTGVDVTTGSTVDFSNTDGNVVVSQDGTNLTFDLAKDITLDDDIEDGNSVQLSGTNGTINAHNSELVFGGTGKYDNVNDMTFDQNGLTVTNTQTMRENGETTTSSTVINGGSIATGNITAGGITVNADNGGTVNGLTNKTWDADNYVSGQAATEDQLKEVVDDIEANDYDGWKVSANGQTGVDVTTGSTVDFSNTDGNVVVSQDGTNLTFDLAKDITLDDGIEGGNSVQLSGTNGTISAHNSELVFGGTGKYDDVNDMTFDQKGLTVTNTQTMRENGETTTSSTVINGGSIATGNITAGGITVNADNGGTVNGLTNKTWNADNYVSGQAATEDQLKEVVDDIEANDYDGWKVSANGQTGVDVTTGSTVDFSNTDGNIVVGQNGTNLTFDLAKDITLDDGVENGNNVKLSGTNGTINAHNSELIFGGTGKYDNVNDMTFNQNGLTITNTQTMRDTGETTTSSTVINGGSIATGNITAGGITVNADNGGTVNGLSNTTWDADKVVIDRAATEGQLQMVSDKVTAGWTATDDAGHKINVNPNTRPTLNFASGKNITVSANEDNGEVEVSLNDVVTLGDGEDAIKIDGTNGTLNIGSTFAVAEDGTVLSDGDVIADADGEKYSLSEVGKYAVRYDKTNDGTSTITLADGDDLSGTRIKNVADGVDPKDAVNVSQLEAVEATANAGWTASDGTNSISIKPNETLNFVGDENLTVSADGTDKKLKVSLNDDITLGNTEAGNTEGERSFTINTTDPNGYVPESYKTGSGANFIEENGGFMLFATDTQGFGVFGVTTKGTAHGKDFVTYTKDIYGNDTRYSLNDVGDAVAQMSSYYNEENRKSYTVFSRYLNEAEKDNPFVTVDEDGNKINATRDIPLALRDDGAVLIGATIKGEDFTDNGIRINAETETTYDEDGNEVTNNIATITGLENTEWTPPAPVATFANEGTETSRAATEAQLNDLYGTVVGYNVDTDGVNYGTVTLGGGRTSYDKDTHEGGTVLNNVAYASGTDGSEAVNVDYLNDAINNAVKDGGAISDSDRHLQEGTYHVNDQGEVELIVADEKGENRSTVTIDNIANKNDITNLDNKIDNTFNDLNDKINNIDNVETDVKGGNINEDGTISLKTENEDGTTTNVTLKGQLTDSGVVQEGTTFDKETGTLTITSQDKYSGKTSSVTVDGIASTDVVGVTTKEELADKYKAADEDGNATTAYITESESMVEADVALDHAIQDVAGTSYANDMVLSNRIDSVEKRLGNVEERIDKVGAMAAAIANLRTMGFDPEAPTEIAIGVGQYKSETGIAIGVFHYPNQDFMLSASLSSSGDELMGGIGATWKLGRKSAAERAKDEEARHLEQAEEMKKLAQQEKVKAQAQRHAKLLAERQQASQKNA